MLHVVSLRGVPLVAAAAASSVARGPGVARRCAGLPGGAICRVVGIHAVAVLLGTVHHSNRFCSRCSNHRYNTMHIPAISVITPSLNSGAFLEDAILSVALQNDVPVEHIVQEDRKSVVQGKRVEHGG